MSRLRHPVRAIREPFGKAGLTVAILAFVMAMVGGAYAAGKLTSGQKKEVEKIAKKFQGTGPAGAAGANGTNGTPGKDGTNGANGAGVTTTPISNAGLEGHCVGVGGTKVVGSGAEFLCNGARGAAGAQGPQGEPWTAGGTLPSNATEKGTWSVSAPATPECSGECSEFTITGGEAQIFTTISFPIPLPPHASEEVLDESHVIYIGLLELFGGLPTQLAEKCPSMIASNFGGGTEPPFEAKAAPGYLCVYEGIDGAGGSAHGLQMEGSKAAAKIEIPTRLGANIHGAGAEGAILHFSSEGTGEHYAAGVWAVTAP